MHHLFGSYKRFGMVLVGLAVLLSIPITVSLLGQQQDLRQRAAENTTPVVFKVTDLSADDFTGGGGSDFSGCINQLCGSGDLGDLGDPNNPNINPNIGGGSTSFTCPSGSYLCNQSCYTINGPCPAGQAWTCTAAGYSCVGAAQQPTQAPAGGGGSSCPGGSVSCSGGCYDVSACSNGYNCTSAGAQCKAPAAPTPTRTPTPAQGASNGGTSCPGNAIACSSNCYDVSACPNGYTCQSSGAVCNAAPIQNSNPTPDPSANNYVANNTNDNCTGANSDIDSQEAQFMQLLNAYRQQKGLSAISTSSKVSKVAAWMTSDMAAHNNPNNHTDSLNRAPETRVISCGNPSYHSENIGRGEGPSTAQQIFDAFKASAPHNAAMIDPSHVQAGISRTTNGQYTFWAIDFITQNDGTTGNNAPAATATPVANNPTATAIPTLRPVATATPTHGTQTTSTPIPATPTNAPNSGNVAINLTLPGIGSNTGAGENANPTSNTRVGYIQWVNSNNQPTTPQAIFAFNNLVLSGSTGIPAGTYTIKAKTDNSLWKNLGTITVVSGQNISLPTAALVTGDLNQDNILNLLDYNIFISCYGTKACDQKAQSDFNMDGKVDEQDLNIFYSGLAKRNGD